MSDGQPSLQLDKSTVHVAEPNVATPVLPVEILVNAFNYLSLRDLLSCKKTSKCFRDIIEKSVVLQYNLEREASLLTTAPNDGDNLPVVVKLAHLRRREAGWANLEWQPKIYKVSSFIPRARLYELQQGFFAQGFQSNPASRDPDSLLLHPLPRMVGDPLLAQVDASTKPIFNALGFVYLDFNIDPEQNLAVYVCRTLDGGIGTRPSFRVFIRLRQLSDNTLHPLAAYEVLNSNLVTRIRCAYYIQIFGDFVGVLAITSPREEDCFWIWNWKTGILQCSLSGIGMNAFIFLSARHFAILRSNPEASLSAYAFRPCYYKGPPTKPCLPTVHIATFLLPQIGHKTIYRNPIELVSEPTPVFESPDYEILPPEEPLPDTEVPPCAPSSSTSPSMQHTSEQFRPNGPAIRPHLDDFRLVVLTFRLLLNSRGVAFTLFVALTDIYHATARFEADARNNELVTGLPIQVPWDDWGRRSTRLVEGSNNATLMCYVYMHRFIFQNVQSHPEDVNAGPQRSIHLFDFNPYAIVGQPRAKHAVTPLENLRHLGVVFSGLSLTEAAHVGHGDGNVYTKPDDECPLESDKSRASKDHRISGRMEVYSEPSILEEGIFSHKVITELPFRKATRAAPFRGVMSPMIDAERILLTLGQQSSLEVLVI